MRSMRGFTPTDESGYSFYFHIVIEGALFNKTKKQEAQALLNEARQYLEQLSKYIADNVKGKKDPNQCPICGYDEFENKTIVGMGMALYTRVCLKCRGIFFVGTR